MRGSLRSFLAAGAMLAGVGMANAEILPAATTIYAHTGDSFSQKFTTDADAFYIDFDGLPLGVRDNLMDTIVGAFRTPGTHTITAQARDFSDQIIESKAYTVIVDGEAIPAPHLSRSASPSTFSEAGQTILLTYSVSNPEAPVTTASLRITEAMNGGGAVLSIYNCAVGGGIPITGTLTCTRSYVTTEYDVARGKIAEALGYYDLRYSGAGSLNYMLTGPGMDIAAETPTPVGCHLPEGGNRFVFRSTRTGVLRCK